MRLQAAENQTQMRQHNNLGARHRLREQRSLTERQFLALAVGVKKDTMTKREVTYNSLRPHHGAFADVVEEFAGNPGFVEALKNLSRSVS